MKAFLFFAALVLSALPAYAQPTCFMVLRNRVIDLDRLCRRQVSFQAAAVPTKDSPYVEFTAFDVESLGSGVGKASGIIANRSDREITISQIVFKKLGKTITLTTSKTISPGRSVYVTDETVLMSSSVSGLMLDVEYWTDGEFKRHDTNIAACRFFSYQEKEKKCIYK